MTKEDNIIVPRWFLEVVENTLSIQNNINLDKKTGETCQDRNIKESLNGVRKLLKGEELTGGERLERLQPSLPDNLDEAAREIVIKMHPCLKDCTILGDRLTRGELMALVKAGAEWMAGQGVILNLSIDEFSCGAYNACVEQGLTSEDDVIVQIRKKEENHD